MVISSPLVVRVQLTPDAVTPQMVLLASRNDPDLGRTIRSMGGIDAIDFGGMYGYCLKAQAAYILSQISLPVPAI